MKQKISVHAFKVKRDPKSGQLADLLKKIQSDTLSSRVRQVDLSEIRVDDVTFQNGVWFVDIGLFRKQHGPGKASASKPVKGFTFGKDECFFEETAFLYIPATDYLLVQYNHHGTRAGKIQDYLNSYDANNNYLFEFLPKYDDSAERRFLKRKATKKITFAIDPRFLNKSDRVSGTALTQALDLGKESGGEKVELTISAGRAKSSYLSKYIEKTAETLKKKAGQNPAGVTKLQVGILSELDESMQVIDLIEERLVESFSDVPLGVDLRYPRKDRYRMLERAHNGWKRILK